MVLKFNGTGPHLAPPMINYLVLQLFKLIGEHRCLDVEKN